MAASPKHKVISLFTGCGGLDLGLEAAGFGLAIAVENDSDCTRTIHRNTNWLMSSVADVGTLSTSQLLREAGLRKRDAALLSGGPPCQPFSKSGYWANGDSKRLSDERADTITHYFRVVEASLPKVILFENVKGIGFRKKTEALDLIKSRLEEINQKNDTAYSPSFFEINAADFGVPQTRERLFMVAHRGGEHLVLPQPTHADANDEKTIAGARLPYATAWDAIGELDQQGCDPSLKAKGKWSDLLPSVPEGHNYLWHTERGGGEPIFGWRTRYWSFLLKLKKTRPSWTLQASPGPATGPFHWRNRRLSVREMARLQTFPDSHEIEGSYLSATRQLGNAVPPAIGELLGRAIMDQFLGQPKHMRLSNLPVSRDDTPRAQRRLKVSAHYLSDDSTPPPHPGTGKGPRALANKSKIVAAL